MAKVESENRERNRRMKQEEQEQLIRTINAMQSQTVDPFKSKKLKQSRVDLATPQVNKPERLLIEDIAVPVGHPNEDLYPTPPQSARNFCASQNLDTMVLPSLQISSARKCKIKIPLTQTT